MSEQMHFFEEFAADKIARGSDPETSKIAEADIQPKLGKLQQEFLKRLRQMGSGTANEIAGGQESVRKRAKELVERGEIKVVNNRLCRVTGKMAQVYQCQI